MQRWPERTISVDFDHADPQVQSVRVANFLGVAIPDRFHARLCDVIDPGRRASGRFKTADLTQFCVDDSAICRAKALERNAGRL